MSNMKKLVAAIAVLTSGTVSAFDYRSGEELDVDINSLPPVEKKVEVEEETLCDVIQETAHIMMNHRQSGVPMFELYKVTSANTSGPMKDFMLKMVVYAYEKPQYSTTSYQQKATQEFADETFMLCVKAGLR